MPSDPTTFQTLMQAMASRYAARSRRTRCGTRRTWRAKRAQGNVDPVTYLPLLKAGYAGTKAGDSDRPGRCSAR